MFHLKSMLTAALTLVSLQTVPDVSSRFKSGVFYPCPTRAGRRSVAREAAFRAGVNRRKPGRYRTAKG